MQRGRGVNRAELSRGGICNLLGHKAEGGCHRNHWDEKEKKKTLWGLEWAVNISHIPPGEDDVVPKISACVFQEWLTHASSGYLSVNI